MQGASSLAPRIAPRFTARFDNGLFSYDAERQRYHMDFNVWQENFYGDTYPRKTDYYASGKDAFVVENGQCLKNAAGDGPVIVTHGGFHGFFGWVKNASHLGQDTWQNRSCEKWQEAASNNTICLHGDMPVYVEVDSFFANYKDRTRFTFGADYNRTVEPERLQIPPPCTEPPLACGNGTVELMRFYVFHPRDQFNISGQDVADARGDADYLCTDYPWLDREKIESYALASVYEVSVVQKFAQYANCYYYSPSFCYGGDDFHIGRESADGRGNHSGQCEEDGETALWERIGIWYSLPQGGLCEDASEQIGRDCTWRIERRVKTFEMSCLADAQHGFQAQCNVTKPPFNDVTALLLKAFASEDPAEGGCPTVAGEFHETAMII